MRVAVGLRTLVLLKDEAVVYDKTKKNKQGRKAATHTSQAGSQGLDTR